jgi:hypothetical protein
MSRRRKTARREQRTCRLQKKKRQVLAGLAGPVGKLTPIEEQRHGHHTLSPPLS